MGSLGADESFIRLSVACFDRRICGLEGVILCRADGSFCYEGDSVSVTGLSGGRHHQVVYSQI